MRDVFDAVVGTLPAKPPGLGAFALSSAGALEGFLTDVWLSVVGRGDSRCDFSYPDFEVGWRAMASSGPLRGAMNVKENRPRVIQRNLAAWIALYRSSRTQ